MLEKVCPKYSISFNYMDKDYTLTLTGADIHTTCSEDVDDELLSGLTEYKKIFDIYNGISI